MTDTLWGANIPTTDNGTYGGAYEIGARFHVNAPCYLRSMRWYRKDTTAAEAINGWRLWDVTHHVVVFTPPSIPDDSTVGWQNYTLTDTVLLSPGNTYTVARTTHGGGKLAINLAGPGWTPDPLLSWDGNATGATSGSPGEPIFTITNSETEGIDVGVDTVAPSGVGGGGGGGDPTTVGNLADWLDTATGTQPNSAPLKTQALATGATGFDAIKAVADAVAAAVSGLPGTIAGAVTTITGQLTALVGAVTDTTSVTVGRIIHDLAAVVINTQDSLVELARLSEGAGTFPSDVGTLVWTLLDETDFAGSIAWAQPADVYVLSITTRPAGLPLNLTDGVHTIYRCGWWTPLNGSFARQRSYLDFEDSHLTIGAERMPGILVSLAPGGEGHIQAWALT